MTLEVRLEGLEALMRIVGVNMGLTTRGILHEVGELVAKEMGREPGPVHTPIRWKSAKQRRYVMAMVRKYGPWQRGSGFAGGPASENLPHSYEVTDESDYRVKVKSNASYAVWVQSQEDQQPFHRDTGWRTDEEVIQLVAMSRDVEQIVSDALDKALAGR